MSFDSSKFKVGVWKGGYGLSRFPLLLSMIYLTKNKRFPQ